MNYNHSKVVFILPTPIKPYKWADNKVFYVMGNTITCSGGLRVYGGNNVPFRGDGNGFWYFSSDDYVDLSEMFLDNTNPTPEEMDVVKMIYPAWDGVIGVIYDLANTGK